MVTTVTLSSITTLNLWNPIQRRLVIKFFCGLPPPSPFLSLPTSPPFLTLSFFIIWLQLEVPHRLYSALEYNTTNGSCGKYGLIMLRLTNMLICNNYHLQATNITIQEHHFTIQAKHWELTGVTRRY